MSWETSSYSERVACSTTINAEPNPLIGPATYLQPCVDALRARLGGPSVFTHRYQAYRYFFLLLPFLLCLPFLPFLAFFAFFLWLATSALCPLLLAVVATALPRPTVPATGV